MVLHEICSHAWCGHSIGKNDPRCVSLGNVMPILEIVWELQSFLIFNLIFFLTVKLCFMQLPERFLTKSVALHSSPEQLKKITTAGTSIFIFHHFSDVRLSGALLILYYYQCTHGWLNTSGMAVESEGLSIIEKNLNKQFLVHTRIFSAKIPQEIRKNAKIFW